MCKSYLLESKAQLQTDSLAVLYILNIYFSVTAFSEILATMYKPTILTAHSKKADHFFAVVASHSAKNCPRKTAEMEKKKKVRMVQIQSSRCLLS